MPEVEAVMRASQVEVHEALLYRSAVQEVNAKVACQKALLIVSKKDLASDMQQTLYDVVKDISIS